jgi:hypothetical protein
MTEQGSGVILTVKPPAEGTALASGFGAAVATIESISLTLATEVGSKGVRVLVLQPNALPESETLQRSFAKYASGLDITPEDALAGLAKTTMLERLPTLEELSNVASFLASDKASALPWSARTRRRRGTSFATATAMSRERSIGRTSRQAARGATGSDGGAAWKRYGSVGPQPAAADANPTRRRSGRFAGDSQRGAVARSSTP